jgi:hypothetical protein
MAKMVIRNLLNIALYIYEYCLSYFLTEAPCVLCGVRTESLCVTYITFSLQKFNPLVLVLDVSFLLIILVLFCCFKDGWIVKMIIRVIYNLYVIDSHCGVC